MRRSALAGIGTLCITLASTLTVSRRALAQQHASPCAGVQEHSRDTVIVFQPPSVFTICRDGEVESGVVTDRGVYLQLAPTPASSMFDFRIHGQTGEWTPMGLRVWQELATKIAGKLRDLDHSAESIADLVVPLDAPPAQIAPLRPLSAARARYLSDVTPRYLEALHSVRGEA